MLNLTQFDIYIDSTVETNMPITEHYERSVRFDVTGRSYISLASRVIKYLKESGFGVSDIAHQPNINFLREELPGIVYEWDDTEVTSRETVDSKLRTFYGNVNVVLKVLKQGIDRDNSKANPMKVSFVQFVIKDVDSIYVARVQTEFEKVEKLTLKTCTIIFRVWKDKFSKEMLKTMSDIYGHVNSDTDMISDSRITNDTVLREPEIVDVSLIEWTSTFAVGPNVVGRDCVLSFDYSTMGVMINDDFSRGNLYTVCSLGPKESSSFLRGKMLNEKTYYVYDIIETYIFGSLQERRRKMIDMLKARCLSVTKMTDSITSYLFEDGVVLYTCRLRVLHDRLKDYVGFVSEVENSELLPMNGEMLFSTNGTKIYVNKKITYMSFLITERGLAVRGDDNGFIPIDLLPTKVFPWTLVYTIGMFSVDTGEYVGHAKDVTTERQYNEKTSYVVPEKLFTSSAERIEKMLTAGYVRVLLERVFNSINMKETPFVKIWSDVFRPVVHRLASSNQRITTYVRSIEGNVPQNVVVVDDPLGVIENMPPDDQTTLVMINTAREIPYYEAVTGNIDNERDRIAAFNRFTKIIRMFKHVIIVDVSASVVRAKNESGDAREVSIKDLSVGVDANESVYINGKYIVDVNTVVTRLVDVKGRRRRRAGEKSYEGSATSLMEFMNTRDLDAMSSEEREITGYIRVFDIKAYDE